MSDIVYKVVHMGQEPYESKTYSSRIVDGYAEVEYKEGKFVHAPRWLARRGYHLLVFDSIERAVEFVGYQSASIWESEATGEVELPPFLDGHVLGYYKKFVEDYGTWPKGTKMYKRVKLLRRVFDV